MNVFPDAAVAISGGRVVGGTVVSTDTMVRAPCFADGDESVSLTLTRCSAH
jgi:hypothetical protein